MTDLQEVYSILLARGYQDQLFSDLAGRRRQSKETLATCPFCGKEGHFSYSSQEPVWRCFVCGEAGDWLHYLQKRRGLDFREALAKLATEAGLEIVGYDKAKHEAYTRKASILEAAQAYFVQALYSEAGRPVLQYLLQRGYGLEDIEAMELGAYVDRDGLQQELMRLGFSMEDIKTSGLLTRGFGQEYTLALLWRDQAGRPIGLAVRSLLSDQELKQRGLTKYKYSYGLKKEGGLVGFSRVRGQYRVVLVEGILDALYLSSKGEPVVAVGGTSLSPVQLKALESAGTRELLLCLDRDEPGQRATEKIIRALSSSNLRAYVVSLPQGFKDPDELVRAKGLEAFREAQKNAERASSWLARRIVSRYDLSTDRGLDSALEEAFRAYLQLEDKIERRHFLQALEEETSLSQEELASRLEVLTAKASKEKGAGLLKATIRKVQESLEEGDILGAEIALSGGLQAVRAARGIEVPEPYLLEDLVSDIKNTTPNLRTGYDSLDRIARIPTGALTIVAGRTGHGKTTLLLNLLRNQVRIYPERAFYFFSYEESKKILALKLIMAMAGHVIQPDTNLYAYINYFQDKRGSEEVIERAISTYEDLTASGRLTLSDCMLSAEDLATTIGYLAKRENVAAVYVDYIQKVPLQRPLQGQRYVEIKRVSQLLLEQAVANDIAIILGAQLGRAVGTEARARVRLDNLRESGDIEQDANLVLGIYNKSADKVEEEGKVEYGQRVDLEISVLKNRAGVAGRQITLSFDRPCLRIEDKGTGIW